MADVTVYRLGDNREYQGATDVKVEHGALTFYYREDSTSYDSTKITTNCPFFIQEKVGGR
jgi:hypothetical protein